MSFSHGGDIHGAARRQQHGADHFLDASASLAPFACKTNFSASDLRPYPDPSYRNLRAALAHLHKHLDPALVLPGNGAAELFTWAARDAAALGLNQLHAPGFADYARALRCWQAVPQLSSLALDWSGQFPQTFPGFSAAPAAVSPEPEPATTEADDVAWITNPHNPTGQLWSRASLEPLLERYRLVISDEAFLPLVPDGEAQSLIPLVDTHANLVVIRSLTKLYGIAGLRLGYAVAQPERLQRWAGWRDPWPVNGIAVAVGERLLRHPRRYKRWCEKVQRWTASEGVWLQRKLAELPGITAMPSAANFLLIRAQSSLLPLREALEAHHRILLRDCRSFEGLGENWLRIGYQSRRDNRRIINAMRLELKREPLA
ncbi:histidinol-phosphate transaminase [Prochlorococcus sp. MIT 1303]|uniref:pyridoxal phosphate-dependent aminotransferase n=1 Tax=Prochlorococcus sp. MIT 1303 TaxID=1723647 RepID=UPI0007B34C9C|nr:aminotransferase class I/II-fold pyridoxal phosphate-dependent enzyme [Prochlorococcus sp. MIT 1303]KZR62074.1 Threonine-phosphate decarboxylase [Prochlorococcus sp. MIT 1303]